MTDNLQGRPKWRDGDAPVLVTGASGFIGREFMRALARAGAAPRALVRDPAAAPGLRALGAEVVRGDVSRPGTALDGVRTVFHLAYDMRASGTANLADFDRFLDALAAAGVRQLVHASSIVVHDGWPDADLSDSAPLTASPEADSYRGAKAAMERRIGEAVATGRLESATILRPTLVYGPGSRFWTLATVERLRAGTVLLPEPPADHPAGAPFGLCHCLHVADLAEAAVRAAIRGRPGVQAYLLSDPAPPTWETYYRLHGEIIGTGAVKTLPFEQLEAKLPPPVPAGAASGGPGLAARLSSKLRRAVGNRAVDAVGARLRGLRRPPPGGDLVPDRYLFELYCTKGRIDVTRAETELGFASGKSVEERLRDMAEDLRAAG